MVAPYMFNHCPVPGHPGYSQVGFLLVGFAAIAH